MEVLVRRLRSLADARTLYAYDRECQGLGQLLEKGCNQMAPQPAPRRRRGGGATHAPGAAGAGAAGPGASGPLVPALAAALATGLRLLFPRGGAAGWEPEAAPPTAAEAVGSLAEAFMQTSGLHESSGGESGGFPVWPDDALMRLLQQTGLIPLCASACAALARVPAGSGTMEGRVQHGWLIVSLSRELPHMCLQLCALAARQGDDGQAAAACLQVADLSIYLLRACFAGGGPGPSRRRGSGGAAAPAARVQAAERILQNAEILGGDRASAAQFLAGAEDDSPAERLALGLDVRALSLIKAVTARVWLIVSAQREAQAPGGAGAGGPAAPGPPGSFARAILLDPERRVQRLAAALLHYSIQVSAVVPDLGRLAECNQRVGPHLVQMLDAVQLPISQRITLNIGSPLDGIESLGLLSFYLDPQGWRCGDAGSAVPLALPPAACAPMARVFTEFLAVCGVGGKAELALFAALARLVTQMRNNANAIEAASPGWRAEVAGALFEACLGRGRTGGGDWVRQRQASRIYYSALTAAEGTLADGSTACMAEHAKAHPAEFCTFADAWLRDEPSNGARSAGSSATMTACMQGPNRGALARATAADPTRLGPRALSLLLTTLKHEAVQLRAPGASPELAASLAAAVVTAGLAFWQEASLMAGGADAGAAAAAPLAEQTSGRAARAHGLRTSPAAWAALMARGLVTAGTAARAATAPRGKEQSGAGEEPGGMAAREGAAVAQLLWPEVPAACDAVLQQLRACRLPGASRAADQLQQQGARIAALAEAAAAEAAAPADGASAAKSSDSSAELAHTLAELGAQLESFGTAACAQLPLRGCCNNPACTNLAGSSEAALVKDCGCSGCGAAAYCSKECQRAHWAWHKPVCKALRG